MEITSSNVGDLSPDERHAAETLLGRPLGNSERVAVRVLNAEKDAVNRSPGAPQNGTAQPAESKWAIPACFNVLADLTDAERKEFDAIVSTPLNLSAKN
jgi:hypothetical protein